MPSQSMTFDVIGTPVPQGSVVPNRYGRGVRYCNDKTLKPWRAQIINEMVNHRPDDWDQSGAMAISAVFRFNRPKSHFGTGRNSEILKDKAPEFHVVKCDLDKCIRAVGDSLTESGLCNDDGQVVSWTAAKRYVIGDEPPGVTLTILSFPSDV